jgi:hypothetical protein
MVHRVALGNVSLRRGSQKETNKPPAEHRNTRGTTMKTTVNNKNTSGSARCGAILLAAATLLAATSPAWADEDKAGDRDNDRDRGRDQDLPAWYDKSPIGNVIGDYRLQVLDPPPDTTQIWWVFINEQNMVVVQDFSDRGILTGIAFDPASDIDPDGTYQYDRLDRGQRPVVWELPRSGRQATRLHRHTETWSPVAGQAQTSFHLSGEPMRTDSGTLSRIQ